MKNKKLLVVSALGAAFGLTLVGGVTYALFTSEANTDITVTSGKVSVSAEVKNIKMYSGLWNAESEAYDSVLVTDSFTNGGSASFANGVLTLDKISPMDKVEFDVEIKNESNIKIKFRSFIKGSEENNALLDALKITISGAEIDGGEFYSPWDVLDVDEQPSSMHITIELPENAGNTLQGLQCQLTYGVEAIQGNAKTDEWVSDVTYISSVDGLLDFANEVNVEHNLFSGKKVKLIADLDLTGVEWIPIGNVASYPSVTFSGIFDGCGHTISNMFANDDLQNHATAGLFGSVCSATIKNLTIKDSVITSTHYAGAIFGYTSSDSDVVENCKVINCEITSTPELIGSEYDNGDKVGGIAGYVTGGCQISNCSVEGTTITAYRDVGGLLGASGAAVKNNTVKDSTVIQSEKNGYKTSVTTYGEIIGRVLGGTSENNTATNVQVISGALLISNKEELYDVATKVNSGAATYAGKTLALTTDIDLEGASWTAIGNSINSYPSTTFSGTFDGCGHTISNFVCNETTQNYASAGLFGTSMSATIKNLTVKDAKISSVHYAGGILGYTSSDDEVIENCNVINCEITSTPELIGSEYDNGDKVGGIVGYVTAGSKVNNCSVKDTTIMGYREVGGLIGIANGVVEVKNNAVKDTNVYQNNKNGYKTSVTTYGAIFGSDNGAIKENNVATNVNVKTIVEEISNAAELKAYSANHPTATSYTSKEAIILAADIDLANEEFAPICATSGMFNGYFDGMGHTISNLKVNKSKNAGLFASVNGTVKNLNVVNAAISGSDYLGVIAGRAYGHILNCSVKNITLDATPYVTSGTAYDGGAKVGGIIGYGPEGQVEIVGCSVDTATIKAYRDLGGICGYIQGASTIKDCSIKNLTIGYNTIGEGCSYDSDTPNQNLGRFYGRYDSNLIESNNVDLDA